MYLLAPFQNIKQFVQIFTANNRYKAKKKEKKKKNRFAVFFIAKN